MNNKNAKRTALKVPPDLTVVAVGGCGKRLVSEICEHEWFLKHYLGDGRHLKVYIMDTDESEREQDEKRKEEIDMRVEEMGGRKNVEISVYHLPYLANISHVSDLANRGTADRIKDRKTKPAVNVWWLNDTEYGISFDDLKKIDPFIIDDFGGGVHRRRAVSKAIFYKVISEGESSGFPTFSSRGPIAIIVGLGGGTGSGMSIDLARYIRSLRGEEAEIWLFGVLPTTKEGEKEQLNAAIALTELEYLNITGRLFNYVVLTSLGPTGFKNGEEARGEVQEFDSVFPYIFINSFYLGRGDIDVSDARKPFSSFIFADSHVIEYPIEELRELKEEFEKVINEVEEITNNRKELNRAISEFLDKADQIKKGTPTKEDFDFVKKEVGSIEKTWKIEIGELLKYQTVDAVKFFITNNISSDLFPDKTRKYDDLIDYISRLKGFSQIVREEELKDEIDKKLYRLIPEALGVIEETARLLKRVYGIEDETTRSVLKEELWGEENIAPLMGNLQAKIKSFKEDIKNQEKKIENKNEELKELEHQKSRVEQFVTEKLDDVDQDIASFVNLGRKIRGAEDIEKNLRMKIETVIDKCKSGEVRGEEEIHWLQSAGVAELHGDIDSASRELGEDLEGLNALIKAIALYYHYDYKLRKIESRGSLQKIIDGIRGTTDRRRRRYGAMRRDKEDYIKRSVRSWEIAFHTPFELRIPDDFLIAGLSKKVEDIKNGTVRSIKSGFDIEDDKFNELETVFEQEDRGGIRAGLRELLNSICLKDRYYRKKKELVIEIDNIEEVKNEKKKELGVMEKIDELAEETFNYRKEINRHHDLFYDSFVKLTEKGTDSSRTSRGLYLTRFGEINPKVLSLISDRSEIGDLDRDENGKKELDKVIDEIKSTYSRLIENYKLGIHNLMIPLSTTERWNFGKAGLVISSTSSYISSEIASSHNSDAIRREINEILALTGTNDARLVTHNYAKPWDISLTFFAAASFLDNISPLTAGGGYREIYERDKDNILHHVLLLQEGKYIVREKLLDLDKAGEIAKREQEGNKVNAEILDLYEEKDIR
ncbi:MAG: Tubulin like protein [Candidatus Argoarchaeum ethanivorans]|uniref:Tubulin like protein n=1 Tax=Candidatus Argoarchaeum ethanivorans TaxID=2608793 RepID=A0A811TCH0_9EURY|nr:MAG: Tubulin like protein [Candidatus Argoarchaeum ethanivorans]